MSIKFKRIRHPFEYAAVLAVRAVVRAMPLGFIAFVGRMGGSLMFMLPPFRRLVCANLRVAFPEKPEEEIRGIGLESLRNMSRTVLELFWFSGRQEYLHRITSDNHLCVDLTRKSMGNGGLIWISPHIGNWELAAFNVSHGTKIPFAVVARAQENPFINKLIVESRSSGGDRVIFEKGAVKGMIKAIKDGCFLATLIDQNTKARDGGVFVDFFGLPVPTSRSIAFFARRMNVNLAVGGCLRDGRGYRMFCVELPRRIAEYVSDEELVQDIMKITEGVVRRHPEQYLWLYKRWQYIPADAPEELACKFPYYAGRAAPRFYDNAAKKKG